MALQVLIEKYLLDYSFKNVAFFHHIYFIVKIKTNVFYAMENNVVCFVRMKMLNK